MVGALKAGLIVMALLRRVGPWISQEATECPVHGH